MDQSSYKEEKQLMESATDLPSVSIILPFETTIALQQEMQHKLKWAIGEVRKALEAKYPLSRAEVVLDKLQQMTKDIVLPGDKKSIVLLVSPAIEKVYFLNTVVPQRIVINNSFELRDLLNEQTQTNESLVLLLSGEKAMLYHRKFKELARIPLGVPDHLADYENDAPERVFNFSDPNTRKEQLLEKFLRSVDKGLGSALKSQPLPVYLLGAKKVLSHFEKLSKHEDAIKTCVHGNFLEARPSEIISLLEAEDEKTADSLGSNIRQLLDRAASEKKLAFGFEEVRVAASHKNGKLLVMERDFTGTNSQGPSAGNILTDSAGLNIPIQTKAPVEEVIENVIASGGDVRLVEPGALTEYRQIALIEYYSE